MRDPGREPVKQRLETLGFGVADIPEDPKQNRPDFHASKDGVTMFVEVKTRTVDAALRTAMESVRVGATESILVPLDKHNSLSSDIENASKQLGAAASANDLRLLWFRAENGPFIQDPRGQIGVTLLGTRMVFRKRNGEIEDRPCVYAGYPDFFRFREIDGAVIEVDELLTLIPNQFSPRHDPFVCSPIYNLITPAIVDIRRSERDDECYVVDSGVVNRRDDDALLAFLRNKYPTDEFLRFEPHRAITTVTTIDARTREF